MTIQCTELFQEQLKEILENFAKEDLNATKKFKLYLDTIIMNMPSKAQKYKQSLYFDDENIREIVHEEFKIPFLIDKEKNNYLILAIIQK